MEGQAGSWPERRVAIARLRDEPYASILTYPKADPASLEKRIAELERLGVKELEFEGGKIIGKLRVLGKGCVGIVLKALSDKGVVAVKIRRLDADRQSMAHEADMLKLANSVGVGPKLYSASDDLLMMEYIDGKPLGEWIAELPRRGVKRRLRAVVHKLLEQCRKLDEVRLDHGELSWAPRNVLVDANEEPKIVDFETASTSRRPSNVTSIAQYLFIGSDVATKVRPLLGLKGKKRIIEALRLYKADPSPESFKNVLNTLRLSKT